VAENQIFRDFCENLPGIWFFQKMSVKSGSYRTDGVNVLLS
jgi:hypothetical protein